MMNLKKIKIKVKLYFEFLGWCISDIRENYQDMKTRYLLETDPELLELHEHIKELMKKHPGLSLPEASKYIKEHNLV
jgi:hypothetical protein